MWLLNIHTCQLEFFEGAKVPPYAILSHRWEDEEVTFQEIMNGRGKTKKGHRKINMCCRRVSQQVGIPPSVQRICPLAYVWIDTCCIDKTSSSELSEAINSMYRWYQNAVICYAYLSDVDTASPESFGKSAWWTRGWTLQELLAPYHILFFDHAWAAIGSKMQMSDEIQRVTSIPILALENPPVAQIQPAANIMAWASNRFTTREEDRAYSLLGLFNVNMPLIYGEGFRAFHRLQEALLQRKHDLTLLCWNIPPPDFRLSSSIFANSPSSFGPECGRVKSLRDAERWPYLSHLSSLHFKNSIRGCTFSGMGLEISLIVRPVRLNVYMAFLGLISDTVINEDWKVVAIMLKLESNGRFRRFVSGKKNFFIPLSDFENEWQ